MVTSRRCADLGNQGMTWSNRRQDRAQEDGWDMRDRRDRIFHARLLRGVAQVVFSTVSRLSRSVCNSGCIKTEEWKKTVKVRSKYKGRKVKIKENHTCMTCG